MLGLPTVIHSIPEILCWGLNFNFGNFLQKSGDLCRREGLASSGMIKYSPRQHTELSRQALRILKGFLQTGRSNIEGAGVRQRGAAALKKERLRGLK